jgi:sulfatase modifying factor 1
VITVKVSDPVAGLCDSRGLKEGKQQENGPGWGKTTPSFLVARRLPLMRVAVIAFASTQHFPESPAMATIKKTSWFFLFSPNRHLLDVFVGIAAVVMPMLSMDFAGAVTIEWVTVGNPGNANDPATGSLYGAVNYEYRIAKHLVTIQQYTDFLNAVDPDGTNPYGLYKEFFMGTVGNTRGILYNSGLSSGQKYSPIGSGARPITWVLWFDAARFANWMHNGQGSGSTETGAYTLTEGQTSGDAPAKSPDAQFYIPTEDEWYKAAYYSQVKGGVGSPGYYAYATQSDTAPGNLVGSGTNQANYYNGVYSVTQSSDYDSDLNYLTDVGAFTNSASFYGTFDQSGNVFELNDLTGAAGSLRGIRGGSWGPDAFSVAFTLSSSYRFLGFTDGVCDCKGFRLASPVPVPEPSTWVMSLAGIACGGWRMWRRRLAR